MFDLLFVPFKYSLYICRKIIQKQFKHINITIKNMNNQVNTQIKVVKIPSATETLSNLNVGDCGFIKTRNLKLTSIRSAVRYLATQGIGI